MFQSHPLSPLSFVAIKMYIHRPTQVPPFPFIFCICWFVWWCLMPLSTIFELYRGSFIGGGNRRTRRKPPTCHKSLTNFNHIMLYTSPWSRFELTTSVMIGTDCIGSCKSNYHTIMATTAPLFSVYTFSLCIALCIMSVHPHFQQYFNYSMVFSIQFSCWRILEYLDNPQYPEKTINLPTIHSTQRKSSICRQSTVPRENHQSVDNPQYPEKTINLPTIHSTKRKPSICRQSTIPRENHQSADNPQYPEKTIKYYWN
jgi:hypothetical protein